MRIIEVVNYRKGRVFGIKFSTPPVDFKLALKEACVDLDNHTCYNIEYSIGRSLWIQYSDNNYYVGTECVRESW